MKTMHIALSALGLAMLVALASAPARAEVSQEDQQRQALEANQQSAADLEAVAAEWQEIHDVTVVIRDTAFEALEILSNFR